MKVLMRYIVPYIKRTFVGVTAKSLGTITELLLPMIMAYIIDELLPVQEIAGIYKYGALMLIVALLTVGLNVLANCIGSNVSQMFGRDLRNDIFNHVQSFSFKQIDEKTTPSLITRLSSDVNNIQGIILQMLRIAIRAPILYIGGIVMAIRLDWSLALILVLLSPVFVLIVMYSAKLTVPLYRKLQGAYDKLTLILREDLNGIKVIRSLSTEKTESRHFEKSSEDVRDIDIEAGRLVSVINPSMTIIMDIGLVVCILISGFRINSGSMKVGEIIAFASYYSMILNALLAITRIFMGYTKAAASAVRVNDLFDTSDDMEHKEKSPVSFPNAPFIEFRNVTFTYPTATNPTIKNLSFAIEDKSSFAIIGGTGSGKSTLLALLLRFYDIDSGQILIEGHDIREYALDELRELYSVIFQQSHLFSGSIIDNIRWGDMDAPLEKVQRAAKLAMADGFVEQMSEKYDSPVLQSGRNFSGGQRQRLSIARAMNKDARALILDDSTSSLDFLTEKKLRLNIRESFADSCVIIIAQRISSVMHCDKILVLDNGKSAGYGTHDELLNDCALYNEIYTSQI